MKVKIFTDYDIDELKKRINNFLKNNESFTIKFITQSESKIFRENPYHTGDDIYDFNITISVFYEERK